MKFIDKTLNQIKGNNLVNNFLNGRWNNIANRYFSIGYSSKEFSINLKLDLKQLLLNEQNNLCCYCMRQLNNDATLEHIVPKSTKILVELNRYTHFKAIGDNVCLQSVFENASMLQNTPPFPLEIAYQNLVASCDGRILDGIPKDTTAKFCNNYRKNNFVEPLFYLENVAIEIEYKPSGMLVPQNVSYISSIQNVRLNYDTLKKIRQVWYYISIENLVDIESAVTEPDRNVILTVNLISLPFAERNRLIADFKTEAFWNILLQYKWFYDYFRNNYPIELR